MKQCLQRKNKETRCTCFQGQFILRALLEKNIDGQASANQEMRETSTRTKEEQEYCFTVELRLQQKWG